MGYIVGEGLLVFGEIQEIPPSEKVLDKKPKEQRSIDILGKTTRASLHDVLSLVNLLFEEGAQAGLSEVELSLSIEASGKFAIPLALEAGLASEGCVTLKFKRDK